MRVFRGFHIDATEAPQTGNCILLNIEEFLLINILPDTKNKSKQIQSYAYQAS